MPSQVYDIERKACDEYENENARYDLLAHGVFVGKEICGKKQKRQKSAINEGQSLGTYGVVGAGEEFVEQIEDIKRKVDRPIGIREGRLTEVERVIRTENDHRRDADGDHRVKGNSKKRLDKVEFFTKRIVAIFLVVCQIVQEEVEEAVEA